MGSYHCARGLGRYERRKKKHLGKQGLTLYRSCTLSVNWIRAEVTKPDACRSQAVGVTTELKCRTPCWCQRTGWCEKKLTQEVTEVFCGNSRGETVFFYLTLILINLGNSTTFAEIGKRPGLGWEWTCSLSCLWPYQASLNICFQKDMPNICSGC